jgi:hypothetical protein
MNITEKMLLDGYQCKSNGLDNISIIRGVTIWWNYRRENSDGIGSCVCDYDRADKITLENDRWAEIALDPANTDHPTHAKIASDEAKIVGDEI